MRTDALIGRDERLFVMIMGTFFAIEWVSCDSEGDALFLDDSLDEHIDGYGYIEAR